MKQLSLWLPIRSIAFLFVFAACAGILGKGFSEVGGGWWSIVALILNVLTILLLVFLAKRNGLSYWQLINFQKGKTTWLQILGVTLLLFVVVMSGTYLAGFLCYRNFLYVPPVVDSGTESACYHQSGALARHHRFGRIRSVSRMWREPDQKQIRGYFCSCVLLCPSTLFHSNFA